MHGLKVTSPLQTLRDLGFPDRLVDEALARNLVHPRDLHRTPTRSELERKMERLLRAAGRPQPLINHRVGPDGRTHGWAGGEEAR
jgi:hypothetical protein